MALQQAAAAREDEVIGRACVLLTAACCIYLGMAGSKSTQHCLYSFTANICCCSAACDNKHSKQTDTASKQTCATALLHVITSTANKRTHRHSMLVFCGVHSSQSNHCIAVAAQTAQSLKSNDPLLPRMLALLAFGMCVKQVCALLQVKTMTICTSHWQKRAGRQRSSRSRAVPTYRTHWQSSWPADGTRMKLTRQWTLTQTVLQVLYIMLTLAAAHLAVFITA